VRKERGTHSVEGIGSSKAKAGPPGRNQAVATYWRTLWYQWTRLDSK
jgi:hypothetical protein